MKKSERDLMLERLRGERDAAAKRGDTAEALILNDRIIVLKMGATNAAQPELGQDRY